MPAPLALPRHATRTQFCGLVLHHPPGQRFILPYPQRGHVIMADPNPVLLYQVRAPHSFYRAIQH